MASETKGAGVSQRRQTLCSECHLVVMLKTARHKHSFIACYGPCQGAQARQEPNRVLVAQGQTLGDIEFRLHSRLLQAHGGG